MKTPLDQAWAQALAAPDDLQARQVLADALQEAGDPHGELIELQLITPADAEEREEARIQVTQLLAMHGAALLGDADLAGRLELRWEGGFVRVAEAVATLGDAETLLRAPAGRLIRSLHFSDLAAPVAQIAAVLARCAPPTLRGLRIGLAPVATPAVHDVAPLFLALPALEQLDVTGLLVDFATVTSGRLARLAVGSTLNAEPALTTLGAADLPALRRLELLLPDQGAHLPGAFLTAHGFRGLEWLWLVGDVTRGTIEALAGSALLARLRQLTLIPGVDPAWSTALRHHAAAYAHLERVELVRVAQGAADVSLADVLPNLVVRPQP